MDQVQAMRAFASVVEHRSFTRAADALGLRKSTITKHVQRLESLLQAKLLIRTTHSVAVTRDGAAYYQGAVRLLADLDDLAASMGRSLVT